MKLSKSNFNSLLLEIFKKQSERDTPIDVLKAYEGNRFVKPSEIDLLKYRQFECSTLSIAKSLEFESILLSPSAPLGSCSTFGYVNQYNVLSSVRGTETLADPSNMLAIIIADRIKNKATLKEQVHTFTTARVVRAQPFPDIKGYYAHFGVLCMVSEGKDKGSYTCEVDLMKKHLEYIQELITENGGITNQISVVFNRRKGYKDSEGLLEKMRSLMKIEFSEMSSTFNYEDSDNNYYKGFNYKIYIEKAGERFEIGDGGFVDWISQMTGNKKRTLSNNWNRNR